MLVPRVHEGIRTMLLTTNASSERGRYYHDLGSEDFLVG